jgi:putative ABC transport system permease protein
MKNILSPRWLKVVRDLFDNKSRTILSVLSIAVGVTAFGGMLTARESIRRNLDFAYRASNPSDIALNVESVDAELIRWAKAQPGVLEADSANSVNGTITLPNGVERDVTINVVSDFANQKLNIKKPVSGEFPPARGNMLIERGSAGGAIGNSGLGSLSIGNQVNIKVSDDKIHQLTHSGIIYDVTLTGGPAATRSNIFVSERTLADLGLSANPTRLLIKTQPGMAKADKYALAERLSTALNLRGIAVRNSSVNERGEHWAAATIDGIVLILVLVGGVAMVMSGFLIVNVVNGLLLTQKKIIGIMKIVGGDRVQVFGIYIVMMLSLGLIALFIAIPMSNLLGGAIARFLGGFLNFDTPLSGLTPTIIGLEVAAALLVPLLFSASPIWSALRTTAAAAISEVNPRQKASLVERALARLENLPRIVVLAFRALFRNNLRLIATMITLIVAGAIFTSIMNLRQALPATITRNTGFNTADITVSFGAPIGRTSAVARAMQIEGVGFAEGWVASQVTVIRDGSDGSSTLLNGGFAQSRFVDVPVIPGGRWLGVYGRETRDEVVINQGMLEFEPQLYVGGPLTLKRGTETKTFRIVGMIRGPGSQVFGHYETFSRFAGIGDQVSSVRISVDDKSDAALTRVATTLRESYENVNVKVISAQKRSETLGNAINALSTIVVLMIVVATLIAIVGGLGLAGTMSLSVMERTREVGVMRAVGAESPDLRLMFVLEGLCIGLLSALVSFVLSVPGSSTVGSLLGNALRLGAFDTQYSALGYVLWIVIVCVVSVLASLSPANRATKISIREALAYA